MKKQLYIKSKNVYKANMHCHTTVSDGKYSPEEIKSMYTAKGYSIVAFTDHRQIKPQAQLNDENFLAINACELDINPSGMDDLPRHRRPCYHFNLYASRADMSGTPAPLNMDYYDIDALNKYILERTEEGFLVCYNHPYWSIQNHWDYSRLKNLFAMEIYNNNCETEGAYGYHPQVYDEMLRCGNRLFCFATDDNYNQFPDDSPASDSFGGFININSKSLVYEDVMAALIKGDFYASQGPEIYEISLEDKILNISCSPAKTIVVYTMGRKCYIKHGENMQGASFELSGDEGYIRIMCRNADNKDASSNAFWL